MIILNKKILILYLALMFVFGLLVVPMKEEIGFINQGNVQTHQSNISIKPLWAQNYSVEILEGNYNNIKYKSTEVNKYFHILLLTLITLSFYTSVIYKNNN